MAFFPRTTAYSAQDHGFAPLFRLLNDFENLGHQTQVRHVPTFQPRFDVRETEETYELHGELAGMKKEDVHIEFADPQTLTVRGKVFRSYTAGIPPAALESDKAVSAIEEEHDAGNPVSHQATVEDDFEEVSSVSDTPVTEKAEVAAPTPVKKPADKYWVTERSIGEFSRSFKFPTRVEPEEVSANLKEGILNITIPKSKKHESRRIQIA